MRYFDAHCDVLTKLFEDKRNDFANSTGDLDITLENLKNSGAKIQVFAIYIPDEVHPSMKFEAALAQVDLFNENIIKRGGLKKILTRSDIDDLQDGEIGAILALEGCDCIGSDILKLKTLISLGVRSVGLTWNHANAVADGIMERRGGGLTSFGRKVVELLNENNLWCDVSHLSIKGFWDVLSLAKYPIASHSNAKALNSHPRNLTDEQFLALCEKGGIVGVNFVSIFLCVAPVATVNDVATHIEHFYNLGGKNHIGIGSDYDGFAPMPKGLENPDKMTNLEKELLKKFPLVDVEKMLYDNFVNAIKF